MNWVRLSLSAAVLGLSLGGMSLGMSSAALAQATPSCQADFNKIMVRRQAEIDVLNKSSKKSKGKLDPIATCPHFRNLTAIETQMVSFMTTNKNWCSIPDEVIKNAAISRGKTAAIANKACSVAAQIKKMQAQQAQQPQAGGPQNGNAFNAPEKFRLPAGPL